MAPAAGLELGGGGLALPHQSPRCHRAAPHCREGKRANICFERSSGQRQSSLHFLPHLKRKSKFLQKELVVAPTRLKNPKLEGARPALLPEINYAEDTESSNSTPLSRALSSQASSPLAPAFCPSQDCSAQVPSTSSESSVAAGILVDHEGDEGASGSFYNETESPIDDAAFASPALDRRQYPELALG